MCEKNVFRLFRSSASGKPHIYIRKCSHYMSRGHEAAVKSCFIHTRGNVAGTFIQSSQQGQRFYAHTVATAVIACPRDMYPQGVALFEFFVPHDFTLMFCHCNMSCQSSFGRTLCGMLQQQILQKGRFLS